MGSETETKREKKTRIKRERHACWTKRDVRERVGIVRDCERVIRSLRQGSWTSRVILETGHVSEGHVPIMISYLHFLCKTGHGQPS